MKKQCQKNSKGFGILEILIASAIIGLAIAGALQFQLYVSRNSITKRYTTQLDKIEFQIRALLSDVRNIQKSANLSIATSATGNNAFLADCLSKRDAKSIAKTCNISTPAATGTTSTTFYKDYNSSLPSQIWFSDLTTTNATPQNDADDDVLSASQTDRSKPFWQFTLVKPPGNASDAITSSTAFTYFSLEGEFCSGVTSPTANCPVQVSVYFRPICHSASGTVVTQCHQAQRLRLRYLITIPANAPGIQGITSAGNMRRTGSFTHTVAGLNNTLNVRYRFKDNLFQTCMAIYQNRKELKFAACANRLNGSTYFGTSHFTHQTTLTNANAFAINSGANDIRWDNTTKSEILGTQPALSTIDFLAIPVTTPCTFSVVGFVWVPKRTNCTSETNGFCSTGTTVTPTDCGTTVADSYFSNSRKCGLYVSYYEDVNGTTKTGTPALLFHNTGNVLQDFAADWPNMNPFTLFASMRSNLANTTGNQFVRVPTGARYPSANIEIYHANLRSSLTDGGINKSSGLWPGFENGTDNNESEYYFKLEDGGDWGTPSGPSPAQDLSVIDFGMQVFADPRVCRHVGWGETVDP